YCIIDSKAIGRFMPPVFPGVQANTLRELARALGLDEQQFTHTLTEFNAACRVGTFDHTVLDDCHTEGLTPPKTHWAQPIDQPPFWGYPLKCGITFTYLGVTVNEQAQIIMHDDRPSANVFAAGEVMAGNILGHGSLAGLGLTIVHVFGRIAGREAARNASD